MYHVLFLVFSNASIKIFEKKKEEINGDSMLKAGTLNNKDYLVTAYQLNLDYDC